ncbi:hypothetical protein BDV93DRAFT_602902 [Ceratobasidium sp. AG-I]|nr:hypothetical protein BDV93DRAFT_602902 [Ceratobasidium sp. AG-I]
MPLRVSSGGPPSSRGKPRYKYKPYYRKRNVNNPSQQTQHQQTSSSNPDSRAKREKASLRSFSGPPKRRSMEDELEPLGYLKRPRPSIGIFGAEREHPNISFVRRLEQEMASAVFLLAHTFGLSLISSYLSQPKGNVPTWLSNTFDRLPPKHPLRAQASVSTDRTSTPTAHNDNPFAFRPPSPPQALVPSNVIRPPQVIAPVPRAHASQRRMMNLASISSRAPITFAAPLYEEAYQDLTIPLNDFSQQITPPYLADRPYLPSPDLSAAYFTPPRSAPSPLFLSDISPPRRRLESPTSGFNFLSSDDVTLPTPTRPLSQDGFQNALQTSCPFVASVYESSGPSLRGLPLDTLVGEYDSSPRPYQHRSFKPVPVLGPTWTTPPRIDTHTRVYTPPASEDIYKTRLLAYATASVDRSSSSGDEFLARRRWGGPRTARDHHGLSETGTPTHHGMSTTELLPRLLNKARAEETEEELAALYSPLPDTSSLDLFVPTTYDRTLVQQHPLHTIPEVPSSVENGVHGAVRRDTFDTNRAGRPTGEFGSTDGSFVSTNPGQLDSGNAKSFVSTNAGPFDRIDTRAFGHPIAASQLNQPDEEDLEFANDWDPEDEDEDGVLVSEYQVIQAEEDELSGLDEEARRELELDPTAAQEFGLDDAARYELELDEPAGDESIMEAATFRNTLDEEDASETGLDEGAALELALGEQTANEPPSDEETESSQSLPIPGESQKPRIDTPRPSQQLPPRNPNTRPFPISIGHYVPLQETVKVKQEKLKGEMKAKEEEKKGEGTTTTVTMTKLSPKFASKPVRRARPCPFAAIAKRREEQRSAAGGSVEKKKVLEDDIESWPG